VKDWLRVHPTPDNNHAYLICGQGNRNRGRKLDRRHYSHKYNDYKKYFQSLLNSPDSDVPAEDKEIIRTKMLTKPWKPYVFRYTSLTEKANGQLSEYQLREHADWTPTSQMPRKYLKFRGDESIKALQRMHGIVPTTTDQGDNNNGNSAFEGTLAPAITCYNCKELNKSGSSVCSNPECKMPLKFELLQEEKDKQIESLRQEFEDFKKRQEEMMQKVIEMNKYANSKEGKEELDRVWQQLDEQEQK
jgi:hypothetical protein